MNFNTSIHVANDNNSCASANISKEKTIINYTDDYIDITNLLGEDTEYLSDALSKITLTAAAGEPEAELVPFYGRHFACYPGEVAVGEVSLAGLPPWQWVRFCTKAICATSAPSPTQPTFDGPDICMWMIESFDANDPSFPNYAIVVRRGFLYTPEGAVLGEDIAVAIARKQF